MPIKEMEQRFIHWGIDKAVVYLVLNYMFINVTGDKENPTISPKMDLELCESGSDFFWKSKVHDMNGVKYILFMDKFENLYLEFIG